ncbi:hypothetical protein BGZ83_008267 [Gryganskiella cystojenkinii]|nr:hypothetical protein BGZ83_008267 [Gryganskiella cystojenkinii]
MIGIFEEPNDPNFMPGIAKPVPHPDKAIAACYFPGSGLGGSFFEYLFDGATASDIDKDCIRVYRYIVQHYTPCHEVWMFGLSRGAYTVRCVAGMINNCGILRQNDEGLVNKVYEIYRSRDEADHPGSQKSREFRTQHSHSVATPIKFMGLFDTVGALGIPFLEPGKGLAYREFYDTKVSCAVEKPAIELDKSLRSTSVGSQAVTMIWVANDFGFCDMDRVGLNACLVLS